MKKLIVPLITMILITSCNNVTELPQVTTTNPVVSDTSVIVGGEVTFTGGDKNTTRGVCWSTSPNPTTSDNFYISNSTGAGIFNTEISIELEAQTTYYIRAFAENQVGKQYGNEVEFRVEWNLNYYSLMGNPNSALLNSNGCVECYSYSVGDTFFFQNKAFVVADNSMLNSAIGTEFFHYCTSYVDDLSGARWQNKTFKGLEYWDVQNVIDMEQFFSAATDFNQDIGNWDVSNVTNMRWLFSGATAFNQDIGNWDVSSVTDFWEMFNRAESFNQDIGNWNLGNAASIVGMFKNTASFNQDIGNWDVSNVTNMMWLFLNAASFNQDLSDWCVSNISFTPNEFSTNSALSASNHPVWGTCP